MSFSCRIGLHKWNGCICETCRRTRATSDDQHDWTKNCEKCARCGQTRTGRHNWVDDCERCSRCGTTREAQHRWEKCRCLLCGKTGTHSWEGCQCTVCGQTRDFCHLWPETRCQPSPCRRCGQLSPEVHEGRGARCSICGIRRDPGSLLAGIQGDLFQRYYDEIDDEGREVLRGLAEWAEEGDGTATQAISDFIERSTTCLLSAQECKSYHGYVRQEISAQILAEVGPLDSVNTLREARSLQDRMIGRSQYMSHYSVIDVQRCIDLAIRAIQGRNPKAPISALGIVFNIDDLDGGSYGSKAWRIFMRNLRPEDIIGCMLKEGDTRQTLDGCQREFCIAVFGLALDGAVVRKAFENSDEKGLAPLARRFTSSPESEPLVYAGIIDSLGRLVQEEWSRIFHDRCKDCAWGFAPKSVRSDLTPELKAELETLRNKAVP